MSSASLDRSQRLIERMSLLRHQARRLRTRSRELRREMVAAREFSRGMLGAYLIRKNRLLLADRLGD